MHLAGYSQTEIKNLLLFEKNASELTKNQTHILDSLLKSIDQEKVAKVIIEGHTDNEGTHKYNVTLSSKRANKVKNFIKKYGYADSVITLNYYGETHPVTCLKENSYLNRRVEIKIYSKYNSSGCIGTKEFVDKKIKETNEKDANYDIMSGSYYSLFFIDVDEDGNSDFKIRYNTIQTSFQRGYEGKIIGNKYLAYLCITNNNNPVKSKYNSQNSSPKKPKTELLRLMTHAKYNCKRLYLLPGDTIYSSYNDTNPYNDNWGTFLKQSLIYYKWEEKYSMGELLYFDEEKKIWYNRNYIDNSNFILYSAFKITSPDGSSRIGYIKLKYDPCTGLFETIDKKISSENYLVIKD